MLNSKTGKILIVDDEEKNRRVLASTIKKNTNCDVILASNGEAVIKAISNIVPDLILLDILMPNIDGYEVAKIIKNNPDTKHIPIIFLTAVSDIHSKIKAFEYGGVDFITKPFNKNELLARINAQIKLKQLQDELSSKNNMLMNREKHLLTLVEEKTRKIEKTTIALVNALENANFYNDNSTGNHIKKVSEYSRLLAEKYGCDVDFVKRIKLYASLHDAGKVGLPDSLLKKPGKYSDSEFIEMQDHVIIGARMLNDEEIDIMSRNIALYHHEKWDGTGYINKLSGEDIPLEARIVSLVDSYDALVSKRFYKEAYLEKKADRIIKSETGKHFDPRIVEIFFKYKKEIIEIKKHFSDVIFL